MANDIGLVTGYSTGKKTDRVFKKKQVSSLLDVKKKFRKKQGK